MMSICAYGGDIFYILACLLAFVLSILLYDDYQANCFIFANSVLERDSQ